MSYNGFTNRETWLINLWFNPESNDDVFMAREVVEADIENLPAYLKDFIHINDINWDELHSMFTDEDLNDE
jgi:hypothetical protein